MFGRKPKQENNDIKLEGITVIKEIPRQTQPRPAPNYDIDGINEVEKPNLQKPNIPSDVTKQDEKDYPEVKVNKQDEEITEENKVQYVQVPKFMDQAQWNQLLYEELQEMKQALAYLLQRVQEK